MRLQKREKNKGVIVGLPKWPPRKPKNQRNKPPSVNRSMLDANKQKDKTIRSYKKI